MTDSTGENTALLGGPLEIYDITELKAFVGNIVERYYNLNGDLFFDTITQEPDSTQADGITPVSMIVTAIDIDAANENISQYSLTIGDLGPLSNVDNEEVKKWLRSISRFSLLYRFNVNYPKGIDVSNSCFTFAMT